MESETHLFFDGGLDGAIFVARDITTRKRVEAAVAKANAKLQLLNSVARHDILNQVTIPQASLELDKEQAQEGRVRKRLPRRELAISNIKSQIDFMRDYQSMGESLPVWQDLAACFRDAAKAFDMREVRVELRAEGLQVFADRMLEKVFHNLIDNTLRQGGDISLISLDARCEGKEVDVIYEDDGVGIAEEERSRIFEMGYGRNSGYGLFLAKEILELTGMSIEEAGEVGGGVRFLIRVPGGAWRGDGME